MNLVLRTQTSCRCLGHPGILWPEAPARGSRRMLLQHGATALGTDLATPFTRGRSFRVVPPGAISGNARSFVGHALGMLSSIPRSMRATEISGWHRRRQTSVCRRHRIEPVGIILYRTHDILWLSPPNSLWPEASARGSRRTPLSFRGQRGMSAPAQQQDQPCFSSRIRL